MPGRGPGGGLGGAEPGLVPVRGQGRGAPGGGSSGGSGGGVPGQGPGVGVPSGGLGGRYAWRAQKTAPTVGHGRILDPPSARKGPPCVGGSPYFLTTPTQSEGSVDLDELCF